MFGFYYYNDGIKDQTGTKPMYAKNFANTEQLEILTLPKSEDLKWEG